MARFHWWSFLVNEEGQPIEGADISIYLAGTSESAYIFDDEFSGYPNNTVPQITSQENGYFEFWIPDVDEQYGYQPTQKFKVYWEKVGIASGYIDYVDIFPPVVPVNELDTDPNKTKAVSNLLAYNWETHRLNVSHVVHGIEEVNLYDDNKIKNRLISNYLGKRWEDHVKSDITDTNTFPLSGEYPHNIKVLDLSTPPPSGEYEYDRVISFYQGNTWNTHVNKNYTDSPHNIEQVDETDSDTTKNKLISNELARKFYYERSVRKEFYIYSFDWIVSSGGGYQTTITHSLERDFPTVQIWDLNERKIISLEDIISVDKWNIKLMNNDNIDIFVVISG